jgi:hypothetical protein
MDIQVNRIIEEYVIKFKQDIKSKVNALHMIEDTNELEVTEKMRDLMEYVFEYPKLVLNKEDLTVSKKKTTTNVATPSTIIPPEMQCCAKRSDGVQCTRKKKKGSDLCGTHVKLEMNKQSTQQSLVKSMEVSAEDINGIIYYIDKNMNVYHTEDILDGKQNPRVIGTATKQGDTSYTILLHDN